MSISRRNKLAVTLMRQIADENAEPVSIGVLASRMRMSRDVASRIASRLVARGLVEFRRSPVDRRISLYSLTPAGRTELALVDVEEEAAA